MSYSKSAWWLYTYTEQFINSGVGINKNYKFHNFKFHVYLWSSGDWLDEHEHTWNLDL